MGKGYVSLSDPKDDGRLSLLSHHLPWYQLEDEGFYAVCGDMIAYCRYCHAERHIIPDCPKKKSSSHVCWNCRISVHIAAKCTKSKNKFFKKTSKTLTVPRDRVNQDKAQQASSSTNIMPMASPSTVSNVMRSKRSRQNRLGDNPRIHSTSLVATEEDSALMSIQEALAALFSL